MQSVVGLPKSCTLDCGLSFKFRNGGVEEPQTYGPLLKHEPCDFWELPHEAKKGGWEVEDREASRRDAIVIDILGQVAAAADAIKLVRFKTKAAIDTWF